MSAIARIALADWQARTRSFAFLIVTAVALEFAYLFVPDGRAGYATVSVDGVRGTYNAAWMGGLYALCTVLLIAFAGFYVVRGSVSRDDRAGTSDIVAASPVSDFAFVAGKWASNLAILLFVATVLLCGCAMMQQVRAENHAFAAPAYLLPFALVVAPTCALVAAFAVLFDAIRPLRGVGGAVAWFFAVNFLIVAPVTFSVTQGKSSPFDAFGMSPLIATMSEAAHAAFPSAKANDISIGWNESSVNKLFTWQGMNWSADLIVERVCWFAIALGIVWLASLAFNRRALADRRTPQIRRLPIGRFIPDVPGLRLLRAELIVLAGQAGLWWLAAATALGIAGAFVPPSALQSAVLPMALLLPLVVYGTLGTRDRDAGVAEFIASAPHAAGRTVAARIIAGGLLGTLPLAGALVHLPALAIVPFAAAALAMFAGRLSGTPRGFEALYVAVWYLGTLNHMPGVDLPADALKAPAMLTIAGCITLAVAAVSARLQLRRT